MTFPALLKKMVFIPEKMILAFSILLWRLFKVFLYIAFQQKQKTKKTGNLIYKVEI